MQRRRSIGCHLLAAVALGWGTSAAALELSGTVFERAGEKYGLDPELVYAVALAESASGRGGGAISPWPWTLRTPETPLYSKNQQDAEQALSKLLATNQTSIDVGIMQISWRWHGKGFESPTQLLDLETNVMKGAEILAAAIRSAPDDPELGIGRYNTWVDEDRARNYGSRVLAIYKNLKEL